MSRRLRYHVAVSLDGFIAGPNGEYDWIVMDPSIDFAALFKQFDTAVMGRKTYEVLTAQGGHGAMPGLDVVVFSRTLPAAAHRGVRIFNDDPRKIVAALKAKPGRDIWLFGGGVLFRSLLDAGPGEEGREDEQEMRFYFRVSSVCARDHSRSLVAAVDQHTGPLRAHPAP